MKENLEPLSEDDEIALQGALLLPRRELQSAYIAAICSDDEIRRSKLAGLLDHQDLSTAWFAKFEDPAAPNIPRNEAANTQEIGKFRIIETLGSGGMGTVFLAEDTELNRLVALKIPRGDMLVDARHQQRFIREAKLAAKLQHPGLVSVLEAGAVGASTYIVSEFCECGDLARWLAERAHYVGYEEAAAFVAELCEAVIYIHSQGVLHLDLKPSNILLRSRNNSNSYRDGSSQALTLRDYSPMIADFGVSRLIDSKATKANTSLVFGTLLFMAPEQLLPALGEVGQQSDLYALGVLLAQLTGASVVREGASYRQILEMLDEFSSDQPAIHCAELPVGLRTILKKSTEKYPEKRYSAITDFSRDLRAFAKGEPVVGDKLGTLRYVQAWLGRPARIRDAWWLCVGVNIISAFWMSAGMFLISGDLFPGADRNLALVSCFGLVFAVNVPMVSFAILGLRGINRLVLPALIFVGACNLVVPLAVLLGGIEIVTGLYDNSPFFESLNHFLVIGFGAVQATALSVSLYASSKSRRRQTIQA